MSAVTMSEAVEYGLSLLAFGFVVAVLAGVVLVISSAGGGEGVLIGAVVGITLIYAALLGSVYKVIADGVATGVAAVDGGGAISSGSGTGSAGGDDPSTQRTEIATSTERTPDQAVIAALEYYRDNYSGAATTDGLIDSFENVGSVEELSDVQLRKILTAVDAYADDRGTSESLREARNGIRSALGGSNGNTHSSGRDSSS